MPAGKAVITTSGVKEGVKSDEYATVTSSDGTSLACERVGSGPRLVMVDGVS